jgi:hypothetical protein
MKLRLEQILYVATAIISMVSAYFPDPWLYCLLTAGINLAFAALLPTQG